MYGIHGRKQTHFDMITSQGVKKLKNRIIVAAIMLLTVILITACSDLVRGTSKNNEKAREPEQTKLSPDEPAVSIDTHKRLEGWTITVYAEEERVFQYTGDIEMRRPREIIVRVEEGVDGSE